MNRITLFLLTFAISINILLIIVEVTSEKTLHLCANGFNRVDPYPFPLWWLHRGCQESETK